MFWVVIIRNRFSKKSFHLISVRGDAKQFREGDQTTAAHHVSYIPTTKWGRHFTKKEQDRLPHNITHFQTLAWRENLPIDPQFLSIPVCHDSTNLISNFLATFPGKLISKKILTAISVISIHFWDLVMPTQHSKQPILYSWASHPSHHFSPFRCAFASFKFSILLLYWHNAWVWHFNRINC